MAAHEANQSAAGCELAGIPVEVKTIEALHFERDVPVQKFRDGRHSQILQKLPASARRFEVEDLASEAVKHGFVTGRADLEYHSAAGANIVYAWGRAAAGCHTVKIAFLVPSQAGTGVT